MRNCTVRVAKTKALISFAVTAKLICAFFAYADCWFSHAAAHALIQSGFKCSITLDYCFLLCADNNDSDNPEL